MELITLGGGCFWGMQGYFDRVKGVVDSMVGYANSNTPSPSYKQVCTGLTNAIEVVQLSYNPEILALETVLARFFAVIDPTTKNRQGNDHGTQYRTAILVHKSAEIALVKDFIQRNIAPKYTKEIVTEVGLLQNFYPAEDYHQKYLHNNPDGYCHIDISLADRDIEY